MIISEMTSKCIAKINKKTWTKHKIIWNTIKPADNYMVSSQHSKTIQLFPYHKISIHTIVSNRWYLTISDIFMHMYLSFYMLIIQYTISFQRMNLIISVRYICSYNLKFWILLKIQSVTWLHASNNLCVHLPFVMFRGSLLF